MQPYWGLPYRVFSAHAEVVPTRILICGSPVSILRARGGSSNILIIPRQNGKYSPRTRR